MLTITATNFGLAPSDIQIREYHNDNMMVLDGEFTVDTAAEEFSGIRPMIHGFIISALVVIVALVVEIAMGIV